MKRIAMPLSIIAFIALLAPSARALPVATDGLTIRSASVQVQSVSTPATWVTTTNVFEGSPAHLLLDVQASEPGVVSTTVTMSGVSGALGSTSASVSSGASSITVPLDLSYGAWSTGSTRNTADHLDVIVSFTPTPPAAPPADTAIATPPTSSPSPSPTPTTVPVEIPATTAAPVASRPAPLRITGTGAADRRDLRRAIRTMPPGVTIVAVIQPEGSRERTCPSRRQLVRMITSLAESSGRPVAIRGRGFDARDCARMTVTHSNTPKARSATLHSSADIEVPLTVSPRPLILVHGMWSSASAWSAYTGGGNFLVSRHPLWLGFAVSTMDTGSPLLPYASVKTVAQNAQLAWTYIQARMSELNAHEVDITAHSLGGVITRRMLHDPSYGPSARSAIRSVVLLGTPNGGSSCSDAWAVPANRELTHSAMETFNLAYPGYPGTVTTSLYSDHFTSTCFDSNAGDLFVPSWSTQAQSVNLVRRVDPGVQHANMTGDSRLFTDYVLPALALPVAPANAGPTAQLTNPSASSTRLAEGTATGSPLSVTRSVTLEPGQRLVASVVADSGASGTLTYPSGSPTGSIPLARVGDYPLFEAEVSYATLGGTLGPHTVSVTIDATTTTASPEWRWSLAVRR